jgi:catechol-2,3-dioxygenase
MLDGFRLKRSDSESLKNDFRWFLLVVQSRIKALGEVNLRVRDLKEMTRFYVGVLGLKPIYESEKHLFLKIADGYEGHTQVIALFNYKYDGGKVRPDTKRTTLHHIAFSLQLKDFTSEKRRLERLGLNVTEEEHKEVHWRSMYFHDPEGNQVEFVSYDKRVV